MNEVSGDVLNAAYEVHTQLGPGLLEHVYQACLAQELRLRGHEVRGEVPVPVVYKGTILDMGFRLDLVVDGKVIVETKAVSELHPIHEATLINYLKLTGIKLGWLFNFHELHLRNGQ